MAKPATPIVPEVPTAPPPAAPLVIAGFTVMPDFDLPTARGGRPQKEESPIRLALAGLPLNAAIFIPADLPAATITDPAERDKAWKEGAKDTAKKVSGAMRTATKADASLAYESRTMQYDRQDGAGAQWGVAVKRVASKAPVTVPSGKSPGEPGVPSAPGAVPDAQTAA